MAEPRDDKVSAAFRGLPPLEPPPALDDAIRAAARRAVAAKPVSPTRRWAIPASIAAVLALSIGIALHVEREKPLVVDGTPVPSGSAEYPVPQAPAEAPAKSQAPMPAPAAKDAPSSIPDAPRDEARNAFPAQAPKRTAPPPPSAATVNEAAPRTMATPAPIPAPAGASIAAPAPAPLPPPAAPAAQAPAIPPLPAAVPPAPPAPATADAARAPPATMPSALSAAPLRAKREAAGASAAKEAVAPTRDQRLERIIELRAAGRHAEADEALALFRRDYPEFVFTPEMWGKVKAR